MPVDKKQTNTKQPKSNIKLPKQPRINNVVVNKLPRRSLLGSC